MDNRDDIEIKVARIIQEYEEAKEKNFKWEDSVNYYTDEQFKYRDDPMPVLKEGEKIGWGGIVRLNEQARRLCDIPKRKQKQQPITVIDILQQIDKRLQRLEKIWKQQIESL